MPPSKQPKTASRKPKRKKEVMDLPPTDKSKINWFRKKGFCMKGLDCADPACVKDHAPDAPSEGAPPGLDKHTRSLFGHSFCLPDGSRVVKCRVQFRGELNGASSINIPLATIKLTDTLAAHIQLALSDASPGAKVIISKGLGLLEALVPLEDAWFVHPKLSHTVVNSANNMWFPLLASEDLITLPGVSVRDFVFILASDVADVYFTLAGKNPTMPYTPSAEVASVIGDVPGVRAHAVAPFGSWAKTPSSKKQIFRARIPAACPGALKRFNKQARHPDECTKQIDVIGAAHFPIMFNTLSAFRTARSVRRALTKMIAHLLRDLGMRTRELPTINGLLFITADQWGTAFISSQSMADLLIKTNYLPVAEAIEKYQLVCSSFTSPWRVWQLEGVAVDRVPGMAQGALKKAYCAIAQMFPTLRRDTRFLFDGEHFCALCPLRVDEPSNREGGRGLSGVAPWSGEKARLVSRCVYCELGELCTNSECKLPHPKSREKRPPTNKRSQPAAPSSSGPRLRTQSERDIFRLENRLPILRSKDEFVSRLMEERVVVVTAQTGSGKTTQLPQYTAEAFLGKTVCTQPRALAASSLAKRVAFEFDGVEKTGHSVGYHARGNMAAQGSRIMFVTDSMLLKAYQRDKTLSNYSVLVIDEAHERSLYTDVVIGISRMVLTKRDDFYVVIASATIDPRPFLEYYAEFLPADEPPSALCVPGRVFPVAIEEQPLERGKRLTPQKITNCVQDVIKKHPEGNVLCFLQGTKEIDCAVRMFSAVCPGNVDVFPLYGSLAPEKQQQVMQYDDQKGTRRMVAFCTNVAETSLTVPGIRVVVDSGLAKEARYDATRRMTVIEEVYVSKSSADQRKGRAGRTAPGYCLRLFAYEDLARDAIQPEIMRSSLDKVALQLLCMRLDPITFPYISPPDTQMLLDSLALLEDLGCLRAGKITKRGQLFVNLPFDPQLSHFIAEAEQYGARLLATEIAAILTAPGTIFFFGEKRDKVQTNIIEDANSHNSDLLFQCQTYRRWLAAGAVSDGVCVGCHKKFYKGGGGSIGCSRCHVRFAKKNNLNNKLLNIVSKTVLDVSKCFCVKPSGKQRAAPLQLIAEMFASARKEYEPKHVAVVGKCLSRSYRGNIGEKLLAEYPSMGVYLLKHGIRAKFTNTSALLFDKSLQTRFFIALKVTKIPSGLIFADMCHPLDEKWISRDLQRDLRRDELDMRLCYSRTNVGTAIKKAVANELRSQDKYKHVEIIYEQSKTLLQVFAPAAHSDEVAQEVSACVEYHLKDLREYQHRVTIGHGSARITMVGGGEVKSVNPIGNRIQVCVRNPPGVFSGPTLKAWLQKKLKIPQKAIEYASFVKHPSEVGHCCFNTEAAADALRTWCKEHDALEERPEERVSNGTRVCVTLDQTFGSGELRAQLEASGYRVVKALQRSSKPACTQNTIVIKNMPLGFNTQVLKDELGSALKTLRSSSNNVSSIIFLNLAPSTDATDAMARLQQHIPSHTITLPCGVSKNVTGKMDLSTKHINGKSFHEIIFQTPQEADRYVAETSGARGHAWLIVPHADLYNIPAKISALRKKYPALAFAAVNFTPKSRGGKGGDRGRMMRVEINGVPSLCGRAEQDMRKMVQPHVYKLFNRQDQFLFQELSATGRLAAWAKRYRVRFEWWNKQNCAFFGEHVDFGSFDREVRQYYQTSFRKRFLLLPLSYRSVTVFHGARSPGQLWLNQQNKPKNFGAVGEITFDHRTGAVSIYVRPREALAAKAKRQGAGAKGADAAPTDDDLKKMKEEMHATFLNYLHRKGGKSLEYRCVFCNEATDRCLHLCGHPFCHACVASAMVNRRKHEPIRCPVCRELVGILDINHAIRETKDSSEALTEVYSAAAALFLQSDPTQKVAMCVDGCQALLDKSAGYQHCAVCGSNVCPLCGVSNDDLHSGISCAAYKQKREKARFFHLDMMLQDARRFVDENWIHSMSDRPFLRIDPNPGLIRGCPAMQRFCAAINSLNKPFEELDTMFTWHGTQESAIAPICHQGFDPSFRSGQAYGPGEYFGQSAGVSLGYCRNSTRMIVAMIIRTSRFSEHSSFCYVVDNPSDFSMSFACPVCVVTFQNGNVLDQPPEFILEPPRKLPIMVLSSEAAKAYSLHDPSAVGMTPEAFEHSFSTNETTFGWKWEEDDGLFYPYTEAQSLAIEGAFSRWTIGQGPEVMRIEATARAGPLRDTRQNYEIFFGRDRVFQRNTSTSTLRKERTIIRQMRHVPPVSVVWQYLDSGGSYVSYEMIDQARIDAHFRAYTKEAGAATVRMRFEPHPNTYDVSFLRMEQTNVETGTVRPIRYIDNSAPCLVTVRLPQGAAELATLKSRMVDFECQLIDMASSIIHGNAASRVGEEDGPQAFLTDDFRELRLLFHGGSKLIASVIVAQVLTFLRRQYGVRALGVKSHGASARGHRLEQLLLEDAAPIELHRNDVMRALAHEMVWAAGCSVHGTFVRDWVLRNEEADSVECLLPDATEDARRAALAVVQRFARSHSLELRERVHAGVSDVEVIGDWTDTDSDGNPRWIGVTLTAPCAEAARPAVYTSVENLAVSSRGIAQRSRAGSRVAPVRDCLQQIIRKEFVLFTDASAPLDAATVAHLKCAYFNRGWTCLSPNVPEAITAGVPSALLCPDEKYDVDWRALCDEASKAPPPQIAL
eukprot:gnl/Chilomastix_cuspidata/5171.p1 GENE.gnl/Chilomastix_cuspidata/5171~~gnl/Chilomastix_cuspidata/5171.p1  ORF type:complete len:2662 (-),score=815.92 gnl/Chilomastix_cuspidata/5171:472-8457(-)